MSLLLVILKRVIEVLGGIARTRRDLSELKKAVQADSDKLNQIIDFLTLLSATVIQITTDLEGKITIGATTTMLTDSQQETLSIQPLDKKGKPAKLDGVPVWASSDETIATVDASADSTGLTAVLTAVSPGDCNVTVSGDADLGAGVTPIVGTLAVTVTAGQATQITINEGTPTDQ